MNNLMKRARSYDWLTTFYTTDIAELGEEFGSDRVAVRKFDNTPHSPMLLCVELDDGLMVFGNNSADTDSELHTGTTGSTEHPWYGVLYRGGEEVDAVNDTIDQTVLELARLLVRSKG